MLKKRQGAEEKLGRQPKTSKVQDGSVTESIQVPEKEPMAKDGGKHKSSSVKPSEDGEGESEAVLQKRKEVREGMYRDRLERLKESEKLQYLQKQEAMSMKRVGHKKTYPLSMIYDEECGIAVFALRSGEIQLHQIKLLGNRKLFVKVQSLNVSNIVTSMTISRDKVWDNFMLCLGTKSSKAHEQSEIVIFQLDEKDRFSIIT